MTIPADATAGIHTHRNAEELYVVLSGKGIHTTEGKDTEINPGNVINTPAGLEHGVKPGGMNLLYAAIPYQKTTNTAQEGQL